MGTLKIAHTGDLHLGLGYPGPTPGSRFRDICRVLDWTAEKVTREGCGLVLLAGDAFKDARVFIDRAAREITYLARWLRGITGEGIPVLALSGTPSHDAPAAYRLLEEMRIPGVTVATAPGLYPVECPGPGGTVTVQVACLPGLDRTQVASREEYARLSPGALHRLMTDKITDIVASLALEVRPGVGPALLLGHLTCLGADKGFEDLLLMQEPVLAREALAGTPFQLAALGHIHHPQEVPGMPVPTFYCGPPERLSFKEENIRPGIWVHRWEGGPAPWSYAGSRSIPTPATPFVTLEEDLRGLAAGDLPGWYRGLGLPPLPAHGGPGDPPPAVVRLRVRAGEEVARSLDRKEISRRLGESSPRGCYLSYLDLEVDREARPRAREVHPGATLLENLATWLKVNRVPPRDRGDLLDRAALLEGPGGGEGPGYGIGPGGGGPGAGAGMDPGVSPAPGAGEGTGVRPGPAAGGTSPGEPPHCRAGKVTPPATANAPGSCDTTDQRGGQACSPPC